MWSLSPRQHPNNPHSHTSKVKLFMKYPSALILSFLLPLLLACQGKEKQATAQTENTPAVDVPQFNADSAYRHVEAQVAFGPRVPGTEAHRRCADYLEQTLKRYGAQVTRQETQVTRYDGKSLDITNLVGSYNPDKAARILLMAHWDSRPWADADPDEANHHTPIPGANDGASGVGVLLEAARLLGQQQPAVGVDILFFDAEDAGTPRWEEASDENDAHTWCLGSQYWASTPHKEGYMARFGILLDMVGGQNATFYKEGYSMTYAAPVVTKVWSRAAALGYASYFVDREGGYITDDHLPVNEILGIPSIDIVPTDTENGGFCPQWHTLQDDLPLIDTQTLKAVGQTVTAVVYLETE